MMKAGIRSVVVIASVCLTSAAFGADQSTNQQPDHAHGSTTVDVKQLPAPVQTTLAREGDHVHDVQQRMGNGSTVYQATISKGGKNYKLDIAKDGTILKRLPGQ